jgi:3-oxoacyl-(acyl-carrier-protein) synthase
MDKNRDGFVLGEVLGRVVENTGYTLLYPLTQEILHCENWRWRCSADARHITAPEGAKM